MRGKSILLVLTSLLLGATGAHAIANIPGYSYAQIFESNSTVTLVSLTGRYEINAVKCLFPSGGAVKVIINNGGTVSSFVIDSSVLSRESNGSGQYLSGWTPVTVFAASLTSPTTIQLNNTGLGTETINCWHPTPRTSSQSSFHPARGVDRCHRRNRKDCHE